MENKGMVAKCLRDAVSVGLGNDFSEPINRKKGIHWQNEGGPASLPFHDRTPNGLTTSKSVYACRGYFKSIGNAAIGS